MVALDKSSELNLEWLKAQINKQSQNKILQAFINDSTEGFSMGITGYNGSGKTVYSALTTVFFHTLYVNLESIANALVPKFLSSAGLIDFIDYSGSVVGGMECNQFYNELRQKHIKKTTKVIIFDSYRVLIDLFRANAEKTSTVKKEAQDKQAWALGNVFANSITPMITRFEADMAAKGIVVVYTCGLKPTEGKDAPEALQCDIKGARIRFDADINVKYCLGRLRDSDKNEGGILLKNNLGLKRVAGTYKEFIEERHLDIGDGIIIHKEFGIVDMIIEKKENDARNKILAATFRSKLTIVNNHEPVLFNEDLSPAIVIVDDRSSELVGGKEQPSLINKIKAVDSDTQSILIIDEARGSISRVLANKNSKAMTLKVLDNDTKLLYGTQDGYFFAVSPITGEMVKLVRSEFAAVKKDDVEKIEDRVEDVL